MRITARYFATLRETRGRTHEDLDVPDDATPGSVFATIFPGLALRVAYAVNQAFVGPDAPLSPGDEVAFLPPVGGG